MSRDILLLSSITSTVVLWMVFERTEKLRVRITLTDIAVSLYLLYGFCNLIFIRDIPPDRLALYNWVTYLVLYIAIRNISNKTLVTWLIVGGGIIQAIYGGLQLIGWLPSNHPDFPVTGSFSNPGPYGGFLAISLTATVWILRSGTRQKLYLWGILVLLSVLLLISNSRAAWLAALIGVITQFPQLRHGWKMKTGIFILIVSVIFCLYSIRPGSANARILVWQVSAGLIKTAPITGLGIGNLSRYYMNAQAEYFIKHPTSDLSAVANNNYQVFNEFIHITVEQGLIGLLLLSGLILTCRQSSRFPFVLAWFVFSIFSYPADIRLLMIVLVMSFALCAHDSPGRSLKLNKKWLWSSLAIIPLTFITNLKYNEAIKNISTDTVAQFPYNREYMLQFARQKQEINILEQLTQNICSSADILCDMGELYEKQENIKKADSCYSLACKMVPCRIKPLYKRFLLHKQRDSTIAKDFAIQILNFKSPVIGSTVLRARADAKKFLIHE